MSIKSRGNTTSKKGGGTVPDENLIYDDTNIEASFPNANNTGIDSTGNVLVATDVNGEAISILKTQDSGQADYKALTSDTIPFQSKLEFGNISKEGTVSDTKATPDMTANNLPSGTCYASSELAGAYLAFNGDENSSSRWISQTEATSILSYIYETAIVIGGYELVCSDNLDRAPRDWTLEGSNDNTSWIVLDTVTLEISWSSGEKRVFTSDTLGSYTHYRLNMTAANGADKYALSAFNMFESTAGSTADTLITDTPIADGDNLVFVLDDNSIVEAVVGIDTGTPVDNGDGTWTVDTSLITNP